NESYDALQIGADTSPTSAETTMSKGRPNEALTDEELTGRILAVFYRVYSRLQYGFLESVYCATLAIEFEAAGMRVIQERGIDVWYKRRRLGSYRVDFLVEDGVIVEVKSREDLAQRHRDQLVNYLHASRIEVGLLLHFGPKARFERKVHSTANKR